MSQEAALFSGSWRRTQLRDTTFDPGRDNGNRQKGDNPKGSLKAGDSENTGRSEEDARWTTGRQVRMLLPRFQSRSLESKNKLTTIPIDNWYVL